MGFFIKCPNCGDRDVSEFVFGGEKLIRPSADSTSLKNWIKYIYFRTNQPSIQHEWWYHKYGCKKWINAIRDITNNQFTETFWPNKPVTKN